MHVCSVCVSAYVYAPSRVSMCGLTNNYIIKKPNKDEQNDMTVNDTLYDRILTD
jgi:hypothetical protein